MRAVPPRVADVGRGGARARPRGRRRGVAVVKATTVIVETPQGVRSVRPRWAAIALGGRGGSRRCPAARAPRTPAASPHRERRCADGDLTVFAAASLTGAFDELAKEFAGRAPRRHGQPINYDGSSDSGDRRSSPGAPADVFASADQKNMEKVDRTRRWPRHPATFATNIARDRHVPPGNPLGLTGLAALATPSSKGTVPTVVLCAPACRAAAPPRRCSRCADVTLTPASEEQNVTAVLTKVKSGDADAGLVYVTDVKAAGDTVDGRRDPERGRRHQRLPDRGADRHAQNPTAAAAFVDLRAGPRRPEVLKVPASARRDAVTRRPRTAGVPARLPVWLSSRQRVAAASARAAARRAPRARRLGQLPAADHVAGGAARRSACRSRTSIAATARLPAARRAARGRARARAAVARPRCCARS